MAGQRHQTSLEGIINFTGPQALAANLRAHAKDQFYNIIDHCQAVEESEELRLPYSRVLLVRYTYEYSRSELSQDTFLRAFFEFMDLDITAQSNLDFDADGNQLADSLATFADFLFDNFFVPLKASGQRTRQPTPAHLSAIERAQGPGVHEFLATPDRLSVLRGTCLVRDHYRCVISRQFDQNEALFRRKQQGVNAQDDEGNQLRGQPFEYLEVAHIIPHSLTQSGPDGELSDSKKAALRILNMFDCDVSHIIEGVNIDRPFNAISLTPKFHTNFGNFSVFFEPIPDPEHTYRIGTFLPADFVSTVPVTRTLYLTDDRSIDPPSPRLLAIHRAVAYILHLSGAGEYIDKILRDMEEMGTRAGGSTELGRIVALRLGGWLDDAISA